MKILFNNGSFIDLGDKRDTGLMLLLFFVIMFMCFGVGIVVGLHQFDATLYRLTSKRQVDIKIDKVIRQLEKIKEE